MVCIYRPTVLSRTWSWRDVKFKNVYEFEMISHFCTKISRFFSPLALHYYQIHLQKRLEWIQLKISGGHRKALLSSREVDKITENINRANNSRWWYLHDMSSSIVFYWAHTIKIFIFRLIIGYVKESSPNSHCDKKKPFLINCASSAYVYSVYWLDNRIRRRSSWDTDRNAMLLYRTDHYQSAITQYASRYKIVKCSHSIQFRHRNPSLN